MVGAAALDVEESAGAVLVARHPVSAARVRGGLGLVTLELVTPVASEERTPYAPWSPSAHHVAESRNCKRIDPPTTTTPPRTSAAHRTPSCSPRRQPQFQLQPLTARTEKKRGNYVGGFDLNLAERAPRDGGEEA
jgi:hypothetical protein